MQTIQQIIKDGISQMRLDRINCEAFGNLASLRNNDEHYFEIIRNMQTRYSVKPSQTVLPSRVRSFGFFDAIDKRVSSRAFGHSPVGKNVVYDLLFHSFCRQGEEGSTDGRYLHRPYPAAGSIYSVEPYLFVKRVNGMETGLYHFEPANSNLTHLHGHPDFDAWERAFSFDRKIAKHYSFVCFNTINFDRVYWKYGARGFQFAFLEAGMALQTCLLVATAVDLKSLVWGGYHESEIEALAGLLPEGEQVISLACFGSGETENAS